MASLFMPDMPAQQQPDPRIQQMRDAEQRRAEAERQRAVQRDLQQETFRRRGQGLRALFDIGSGSLRSTLGGG